MGIVLPLLWAIVGPELPEPAAIPAPDVVTDGVDAAHDALAGWRTATGGLGGCAVGAGVPLATAGGGSGLIAILIANAATFGGTLSGITPALCTLGTGFLVVYPALMCFPLGGALFTTAGAAWGAQNDGHDPMAAFVGAGPGLALAFAATVVGLVATGMAFFGGIGLVGPTLLVVLAAVALGLPAPALAYVGAVLADAVWPQMKSNIERRRRAWAGADEASAVNAMAY